jgi:hypothetical protein
MKIKTQGGKVITKGGKVSCECCEGEECCPYSARAFVEGLYTVDDLPDEISVTQSDIFTLSNVIFTKTGGDVFFYEATQGETLYSVGIKIFFTPTGQERIVWILTDGSDETGLSSLPDCLIVEEDEANPSKDTFADTYAVNGPISGTVTRESICVWAGEGLRLTNFGFQWKLNGNNKSGFQNTPVGNYAGGFTVS